MGKVAMLSFDLIEADDKQRKLFYEKLEKYNWKKLKNLSTIWKASFDSSISIGKVINITKSRVEEAANYAKIKNYNAVVHVGDSSPTEFRNNLSKLQNLLQNN